MEEKKLSKVLDEIFGSYINNETETVERINEFSAPRIDLNNFIESLFLSKDIIANNDLMFNSIHNVKLDIKPVAPAVPILENFLQKENVKIKAELKFDNIYDETLPLFQQAFIAKAVCNQLCELLIGYSKFFKFSKRSYAGMPTVKNQIMEIMLMAEHVYQKIAGKSFRYADANINFNSYNSAVVFIRNKTITIIGDITILKNNTNDLEIKKNLVHIESVLESLKIIYAI